jgi:cytoskeletal protein CcmA (bactofilin family)
MDIQEVISESEPMVAAEEKAESKRDGQKSFTLGRNDSLEGKLRYEGSMQVDGRAEGEFRLTGNVEVGQGATLKALVEASSVTVLGEAEGTLSARDKLTLGRTGKLNGDLHVNRLQIEDGATFNGTVRMGGFE